MLRNKEIQEFTIIFTIITIVSTGAGIAIHPAAAILALISAAAFGAAFLHLQKPVTKALPGFRSRSTSSSTTPTGFTSVKRRKESFLFCKAKLPK